MEATTDMTERRSSPPCGTVRRRRQYRGACIGGPGCRRALWYAATKYSPTNPPSEESLVAMEAGNALEPVVFGRWSGLAEGRPRRPTGPAAGSAAHRPQHRGDGTPRRHGADARCRRKRPRPRSRRSCSGTRPSPTATRRWWRSRRGARRRSSGGTPWEPSAAIRRRWPRPPSTPWEPTGRCETP